MEVDILEALKPALSCAVPLWILRLKHRTWSYVEQRAHECAQIVAEKGDVIMFRSKRQGETAAAFNALAEGLACLSFVPGGVKLFGLHFEDHHPETGLRVSPWFDELARALCFGWDDPMPEKH